MATASTWAQSSYRSPFAPAPAKYRCQARLGIFAINAFTGNFPVGVATWWLLETADT
ncbi:hypothetical protein [Streptomyces canus]|uniref:hypothetical protein n=1 Tax=Streptomyces canus TaxID=58343 RepID=UPI0032457A8A